MKNEYDVIIIGGGPGGLKCAEQLKDSNLSVLLVERSRIIGPKVCAGGLTNLVAASDIPAEKARSFKRQTVFLGDRHYDIDLVNPLKTIGRSDLGRYQLTKIENSGNITILKETSVKWIKENKIITDRDSFHFKYLVGADGSSSVTRRHLALKSKACVGLYYNILDVTDDLIWYINPPLLKSGYIWVFPHRDYTNIGIYFDPQHIDSKYAKRVLQDYLADQGHGYSDDNLRSAPINYLYKGCVFDSIFLVGDAAGLASKTTGEGISFALISGAEIGKKILDPAYRMVDLDRVLAIKYRQERMLRIFEAFPCMQRCFFKGFVNLVKRGWFQRYLGA